MSDSIEKMQADLAAAISALRVIGEETVLAGYAAGDRTQTLANVRALRARVAELEAERLQRDVAWREAWLDVVAMALLARSGQVTTPQNAKEIVKAFRECPPRLEPKQ